MRYRSQSVAYWYFAVAMVLFGLQLVFGLLSASKYLGPDPLLQFLPFDITKVIHTNLLIVWVLTGFMGAFTTFSAFMLDCRILTTNLGWLYAVGNIALQNTVGALALVAGIWIARIGME